jgi:hypothetical protein
MAGKSNEMAARFARVSRTDKPMPATQPDAAQQPIGTGAQRIAKTSARQPIGTEDQMHIGTSAHQHNDASTPMTRPKTPYTKRMPLTLTPEDHAELLMARARDGIEATARLRAMVALWRKDEELRRRIDEMARELRRRDASQP